MLIPDLLNIIFDQSNYCTLSGLSSLHKRKTTYANKYSLLRYYTSTVSQDESCLKILKYACPQMHDDVVIKCMIFNAENGNLEAVKYFISIGVNIHACGDGAIKCSAFNGKLKMVKYLISVGANVEAIDEYMLAWSDWVGHVEVFDYLSDNHYIPSRIFYELD